MRINFRGSLLTVAMFGLVGLTGCGADSSLDKLAGISLSGSSDDRGRGRHAENENEYEHGPEHESGDDHGRRGGDDTRSDSRNRIKSPGDQSSSIGAIIDLTIQKTRADEDDIFTFSATGLPSGLTIDPVSGKISGTISGTASTYSVTVQAMKPSGSGTHVDRYVVTFKWMVNQ